MDILCTDKTGTLTEGVVEVEGAYDTAGAPSTAVLELGACNAALETGIASPLDEAILQARTPHLERVSKLAEIPFDFVRKRVTVVAETSEGARLITKGAFHHVLEVCTRSADGTAQTGPVQDQLEQRYQEWSRLRVRVLAIAVRSIDRRAGYGREDERDLTFMGFLTFFDRPKAGVTEALADLAALGVSVKVITGDSCRAGSRRLRAAETQPRCDRARYRGGAPDICEHPQVHPDHHERQARQHGQHGRRLAVPAVLAAHRRTDPA